MSVSENGLPKGLVERVKGILLRPGAEWDVIDTEPATVKGLFTGYAMILAAIGPVASAIGSVVFGVGAFGFSYHANPVSALVTAIVTYVMSLAGIFVLSLIIDQLAPNFGGTRDKVQATKVAVYSATAAWVAGIFGILPSIGLLAVIGGLYSLYLLYLGLPKLMKAPQEKALPYTAVVIVVAIVVQLVIGAVTGAVVGAATFGAATSIAHNSGPGGKFKVGDTEVDLTALEAQAKQAEASAKQLQAQMEGKTVEGAVTALPAETLKALLPGAVAGFARTEVESSSGGVGGLQGSNAQGSYERGEGRLTLNVTDMAAAGGLAGIAGSFNVSTNKETATGYEKMGKVGGRMTTENYDRSNQSGEYSVLVGNRFMVQAQGSNVSMDDLKAAVGAVGLDRLEGLAKG